jgi:3-hydroxyisobutyrate dehydrogenase-like beta-hydroxyacid dehydrogenase|tara:strand:- start:1652 stop:2524 length:873 start_codon:yes stop_codon:yes gene_type:complete
MNKTIGFIGLGVMGFPMAGHLSKIFEVSVFNRSHSKSEKWKKNFSGTSYNSIKEISSNSEILILCVGNDKDVKEIICGQDGAIDFLKPGSIIIDHTTTSSDLAIELSSLLKPKKISFIDAPISGGQSGAESGKLSIMIGGERQSYEKVKNVLNTYSKFYKYMGPSGSGQLTKMVNQICIAGLIQALSEGMNFADKVGLNIRSVIEVISKGAAQSWQMENRWETMLKDNYDHGFAVDLMKKDLDIVIKKASKENINIEVTKIIDNYYKEIQGAGGGKWDTSSLYKRLKDIV